MIDNTDDKKRIVATPLGLKYKSAKFSPGCVKEYLKELEKYDRFVGVDFGDGTCTVFKAYIEEYFEIENGVNKQKKRWTLKEVKIPKVSTEDGVPTAVVYKNGEVIIGEQTKNNDNIYYQFKVSPDEWDQEYNSRKKRDIAKDFLSELWKKTLDAAPDIKENAEKTLVIIGHPGAEKWVNSANQKEYEKMLTESFPGYKLIVMAEPAAAIYGELYDSISPGKPINISSGVFIVEPGSSTTDICYILLGRKIFTDSIDCAGRNIDELLYKQVINDQKKDMNLNEELFYYKSVNCAIWDMKAFKEAYCDAPDTFNDKNNVYSSTKAIKVSEINPSDPDGQMTTKTVSFRVNEELFDKALNMVVTDNTPTGPVTWTWTSKIEKFLNNNKSLIEKSEGGCLCDKMILAGGTSKVPHFEKIARKVFQEEIKGKEDFFHKSKNPTQIVSKGLAYSNVIACRFKDLWVNYDNIVGYNTDEGMADLAEELSEEIASLLLEGLKNFCQTYLLLSKSERPDFDKTGLNREIFTEAGRKAQQIPSEKLKHLFFEAFKKRQKDIKERLEKILNIAYGVNDDKLKVIELSRLESDLSDLSEEAERMLKAGIANVAKGSCVNNWIYSSLRESMKYFFQYIDEDFCRLRLKELNNEDSYRQKIMLCKQKVKPLIKNEENFRSLLNSYLDVQAEIYIGKALFLVTGNKKEAIF